MTTEMGSPTPCRTSKLKSWTLAIGLGSWTALNKKHHWLVVSTHLKNIIYIYSQNGNLPQVGMKIKNVWNHHLDHKGSWCPGIPKTIHMQCFCSEKTIILVVIYNQQIARDCFIWMVYDFQGVVYESCGFLWIILNLNPLGIFWWEDFLI